MEETLVCKDKLPRAAKFRGSRRNGIRANGDVTGLSRTCRGHHGEVGIVEFELDVARRATTGRGRQMAEQHQPRIK